MIDGVTAEVVQGIIRRESRSLLQYLPDAFPWTKSGEQQALGQLFTLIEEQRAAVAELMRFLGRQRVTPGPLGPFPMSFTTLNFVSLDSLLPRVLKQERHALAALEKDLAAFHDPDGRVAVHRFLELKQRHLKSLEALAPPADPVPA
jgi:hypothetical protein